MAVAYSDVEDSIHAAVKAGWVTNAQASIAAAYLPELAYENKDRSSRGSVTRASDRAWARLTVLHGAANTASLPGGDGKALYRRQGIAWVQVFYPFLDGSAKKQCERLALVARDTVEGKRAGLARFMRTDVTDLGARESPWWRFDVKAAFEWFESK